MRGKKLKFIPNLIEFDQNIPNELTSSSLITCGKLKTFSDRAHPLGEYIRTLAAATSAKTLKFGRIYLRIRVMTEVTKGVLNVRTRRVSLKVHHRGSRS